MSSNPVVLKHEPLLNNESQLSKTNSGLGCFAHHVAVSNGVNSSDAR